jgi:hypothetical protein
MSGVEKCGERRRRRRIGCRFDVGVVSDALCQEEAHLSCKELWLHPSAREPTRDSDVGCVLHEPSHASSREPPGATTPHGVPSGVSTPNLGRRNTSTASQGGRNGCRVACKFRPPPTSRYNYTSPWPVCSDVPILVVCPSDQELWRSERCYRLPS